MKQSIKLILQIGYAIGLFYLIYLTYLSVGRVPTFMITITFLLTNVMSYMFLKKLEYQNEINKSVREFLKIFTSEINRLGNENKAIILATEQIFDIMSVLKK